MHYGDVSLGKEVEVRLRMNGLRKYEVVDE